MAVGQNMEYYLILLKKSDLSKRKRDSIMWRAKRSTSFDKSMDPIRQLGLIAYKFNCTSREHPAINRKAW